MSRNALYLLLALLPIPVHADTIAVAVASNFKDTLNALAADFEAATGHIVQLSAASTGKHYAQISHGAPFDVFFAADNERPGMLEREGFAVPGTRFVYASGRITLWGPAANGKDCLAELKSNGFRRIAIANPKTAPYGVAAEQVLAALALTNRYFDHIVMGENISQAMHFVDTGAAAAGFVATSQWLVNPRRAKGCNWEPPAQMFDAIVQEAQLLVHGKDSAAAKDFLAFVRSPAAREVIRAQGYHVDD